MLCGLLPEALGCQSGGWQAELARGTQHGRRSTQLSPGNEPLADDIPVLGLPLFRFRFVQATK